MNSVNILRALASVAAACSVSILALPASAQQPRPPAGVPAAPQPAAASSVVQLKGDPNQADWTKVCGKDPESQRETCYTTRDFVAENNAPVLAVAVYETKAGARVERQVRYLLPLTFLLQPGIRTSIDGGQPIAGRYTICVQNGCFAEFTVNDQVFARMKTGKNLTIQVQNQAAREVSFALPMEGFAKGFDGAPVDPRVLEEQQKKLQEELQRRSDELRKQIQGGAAGGTAPVPGGALVPGAPPAAGAPAAPKP